MKTRRNVSIENQLTFILFGLFPTQVCPPARSQVLPWVVAWACCFSQWSCTTAVKTTANDKTWMALWAVSAEETGAIMTLMTKTTNYSLYKNLQTSRHDQVSLVLLGSLLRFQPNLFKMLKFLLIHFHACKCLVYYLLYICNVQKIFLSYNRCKLSKNVTRSREMSHMSAMFNFEFSILSTCPFLKILHFDPNPITIRNVVPEI